MIFYNINISNQFIDVFGQVDSLHTVLNSATRATLINISVLCCAGSKTREIGRLCQGDPAEQSIYSNLIITGRMLAWIK